MISLSGLHESRSCSGNVWTDTIVGSFPSIVKGIHGGFIGHKHSPLRRRKPAPIHTLFRNSALGALYGSEIPRVLHIFLFDSMLVLIHEIVYSSWGSSNSTRTIGNCAGRLTHIDQRIPPLVVSKRAYPPVISFLYWLDALTLIIWLWV